MAVIPARFASTRFPGKVIARLAGKPLVVHVYERVRQAGLVDHCVIATDDERVAEAVRPFGCEIVMTRSEHPSGTDRIAEVALASDAEIIVNVQGDEPLIEPETINATIQPLLADASVPMATAKHRIANLRDIGDPNVVKVVCDTRGFALYFSRAPIPHARDVKTDGHLPNCYWRHIGIYAYRREFLLEYAAMTVTPLEKLEKLEQLRVLENGRPIAVVETEYEAIGVDTREDLERVRAILEQRLMAAGGH